MWMATLEEEERDRLDSLKASISVFETKKTPEPQQINALLVSALQAQVTLMRMSRVFPNHSLSRSTHVSSALSHEPTAALACELHHCWKTLGVSGPTLEVFLRDAVFAIGEQTRRARGKLFANLLPRKRGADLKAHTYLAAEGSGQFPAICVEMNRLFPVFLSCRNVGGGKNCGKSVGCFQHSRSCSFALRRVASPCGQRSDSADPARLTLRFLPRCRRSVRPTRVPRV